MSFVDLFLNHTICIAQQVDRRSIQQAIGLLYELRVRKGRLFIIGNGGSAANASHAVNDFRKIAHIEAYAPTDNVAELTAWVNDLGWDLSYSRWLEESRLNADDLLLVLSVGGGSITTSVNLVNAMKYSLSRGCGVVSIVGRDGGKAKELSDVCILIPTVSENHITPHVESWQSILLHLICNELSH